MTDSIFSVFYYDYLKGWKPITEMVLRDHLVVVTNQHADYYFVASNDLVEVQKRWNPDGINMVEAAVTAIAAKVMLTNDWKYHYIV